MQSIFYPNFLKDCQIEGVQQSSIIQISENKLKNLNTNNVGSSIRLECSKWDIENIYFWGIIINISLLYSKNKTGQSFNMQAEQTFHF
jgi:hypothetical protein